MLPLLWLKTPETWVKRVVEEMDPPKLKFPEGAVKSPSVKVNVLAPNAVVPPKGVTEPDVFSIMRLHVRAVPT